MESERRLAWKLMFGLFLATAASAGLAAFQTKTPEPAAVVADVTFTKDIAPILQRSCETCHRANGGAPMALTT